MIDTDHALRQYYDRRAEEYEQIYRRDDPLRQEEQAALAAAVQQTLAGRCVLEVACGTGYWTAFTVQTARHIVGIDASKGMLALAQKRDLPADRVTLRLGDAYDLAAVSGEFDAGLATFWLSHVPKARLPEFLRGFHGRLGPAAVVLLADNVYLPNVGGELVEMPGSEDTYKLRTLADGSPHCILKNYYHAEQLRQTLGPWAGDLQIHIGTCFWWVTYVPANPEEIQ